MQKNKIKVLVTGAAGFIGYHLIKTLSKRGYDVVGIDSLNDYYDVNLKIDRLKTIGINIDNSDGEIASTSSKFNNLTFYKVDIVHLDKLINLFKANHFTHVVHLAAQAGVRYSIDNPHCYAQSNLVGYLNILECCRKHQIYHLLYASSSSIYGNSNIVPFSEKSVVDKPVSLYAATKRSNELIAHSYSHLYQIPTTGLRFFTVYGPWGRPDMAPMLFAKAVKNNEAIKVFNSGNMERDFTYVDDVVNSIIALLPKAPDAEQNQPFYRILNIGNSNPVNLLHFIQLIENYMGIKAKKLMYPMQDGDVERTWADTTQLNNLVELPPFTELSNGIKLFVDWYKSYFK